MLDYGTFSLTVMPNKKAAIKDLRQSKKRAQRNASIKTHAKVHFNKAQELLNAGNVKDAAEMIKKFQQIADKAAKKNALTKNKVNRKKSKLMKAVAAANKK